MERAGPPCSGRLIGTERKIMASILPEISIVIPVYNEAVNLRELFTRIVSVIEKLNRTFEVVAVDDGSSDNSLEILKDLHETDSRLRIVRLSRNFGQTPALYAGFANVRGAIVLTIDADLQNPPEEIPRLIEKIDEGYDVAQGWRDNRQDSALRRIPSKVLNKIVSYSLGLKVRDLGCGMKAFRREIVDRMSMFTHHARYVPAEVYWLGVKVAEIQVEHHERAGGRSKYGLFTLLRLNFDMISSVTTAPVKLVGLFGGLLSFIGFAMALRIGYIRIYYGNLNDMGSVTAIFFFLTGVQMVALGLVCEYVGRIFVEVQAKPYFIVRETIE